MSTMTLFILFVAIIALLFLVINFIFAPHNPYLLKIYTISLYIYIIYISVYKEIIMEIYSYVLKREDNYIMVW